MFKLLSFVSRYLLSVSANLYVSIIGLLPRNREACYEAAYQLGWRNRPVMDSGMPPLLIPTVSIAALVADPVPAMILESDAADGNVTEWELTVIAMLCAAHRPDACFEIGTFDGRTTLNLAANMSPDGCVYTLDLAPDALMKTAISIAPGDENFILKKESGTRFKDTPYAGKIIQLWGDSAVYDYSSYWGKMDLVFVDGAHSYDYVVKDTETALKLLKPGGGIILWHDYGSRYWKDLTRALNEIHERSGVFAGMRHIKKTAIVVLKTYKAVAHD